MGKAGHLVRPCGGVTQWSPCPLRALALCSGISPSPSFSLTCLAAFLAAAKEEGWTALLGWVTAHVVGTDGDSRVGRTGQ